MPLTALYGGVLAVIQLVLSGWVVLGRWKWRLNLGDGGHKAMEMRIRAHGNFVEYVPMTLVLLAIAEASAVPTPWLHGIGGCLVVGRLLHAWGFNRSRGISVGRFGGMTFTYLALLLAAAAALWVGVRA